MSPGEYAVHYSSFDRTTASTPFCTVLSSLPEAEAFAQSQITQNPTLRCRIYDHHGFIGKPIAEFRGADYKGESEISARFRRWAGSILFFGGLLLIFYDSLHNYELLWPATIGIRLIFPGLILLITELVLILYARRKHQAK